MSPKSASSIMLAGGSVEKKNGWNCVEKNNVWNGEKALVDPISQYYEARDEDGNGIRDEDSGTSEEKRATPLIVPDNVKNVPSESSNEAESQSEKIVNVESQDNHGIIRNRSALSHVTTGSVLTEYVNAARDKIDDDDVNNVWNAELQIRTKTQEKSLGDVGFEVLQVLGSSYGCGLISIFECSEDLEGGGGSDLGYTTYDDELMKNLDEIINEDNLSVFLEIQESESTQVISNIKQDLYAKARRHHPSIREAMLNLELSSRKAEIELRKIELESRQVDAELTCLLDSDDESDDGLFDIIEALSTFHRYMGGHIVSSAGSISTNGSTIATKGSMISTATPNSPAESVGVVKMAFV
eukprot:CAMPEP_0172318970 /NCGR_PEP_ID=MMETSP1058-20130122/36368_1 /TAXON_ID=83371 /ORGANISM="Detonula confervacea, Strain CCMP 353" /LENGTH=354 /DNA_ID=CAMNT_0013033901 /DNA_START=173 /DNA_END=1237 /DNA_ORIENTATION=-